MKDYTGSKFGKLTAVKALYSKNWAWFWEFVCECGNTEVREASRVAEIANKGRTPMCAECRKKAISELRRTHGLSGSRLHSVWASMMQRCYNSNHAAYKNYGGRGISVCDAWHDFAQFYADMSPTYKEGLELDRIDNNSGYSKLNCRWVTRTENQRNTRKSLKVPLKVLAEQSGISYGTLWQRFTDGWPEKDLLIPPNTYINRGRIKKCTTAKHKLYE